MAKWYFLFAVLCASFACSNKNTKGEKPKRLVEFSSKVKLERHWRAKVGGGQVALKYARLTPAIEKDTIYAANAGGSVYAYSLKDGSRKWKVNTGREISGGVTVVDGRVYFGTLDAYLVVIDAQTGQFLWDVEVSSEILSRPAVRGNDVVVQTIDSRLFAFNVSDGSPKWVYDHLSPILTLRSTASPVITASQVIAAFDNGQVVSVSLRDGATGWNTRVAQPKGKNELERIVDVDSDPIVSGGVVYTASYQGNVVALNRGQGKLLWKKPISTYRNVAEYAGTVYVSTEDSELIAINATTGEVLWQNEQLLKREISGPVVIDNHIAVIDFEGYMHLLSQEGEYITRTRLSLVANPDKYEYKYQYTGKGFDSPVVVKDDVMYVLGNKGYLSAYSVSL